jgi:hypothetical protein
VKSLLLWSTVAGVAVVAAACTDSSGPPTALAPSVDAHRVRPVHVEANETMQLFMARGESRAGQARHGGSPDMTWHGGPILPTAVTGAIFWGTSWNNGTFVGDKITGIDAFYTGFNGSNYAGTSDEYTAGSTRVSSTVPYSGHFTDLSAAPGGAPSVSAIVSEVCTTLTDHSVTPVSNGFYMVYGTTPRGHTGYCAWHSNGTCNGTPIQVAWSFDLDGDAGCDPGDTQTGHSQGLSAIANVSAHELSETRTDPEGNAWYDGSGAENGDKCAWTFNVPYVSFANKTIWKVQGEWSNNAYNTGTGYPNSSGQKGCLDGA